MRQVEPVIELPSGGVALWVVFGLGAGVATSLLPYELLLLGGCVPFFAMSARLVRGLWSRVLPVRVLVGWSVMMVMVIAAIAAPRKFVDEPISYELPARRVSVRELAKVALVTASSPEVEIDLPSRRPTWRQLREALGAAGLTLDVRYSYDGASLLFGASPFGPPIVR